MGLMSMISVSVFRTSEGVTSPEPTNILPYYGVSAVVDQSAKTGDFILALPHRGPTPDRLNPSFILNAPTPDLTMYYAYPVAYGEATFLDVQANFQGGWDGAHGDYGSTLGPLIVPVTIDGHVVNFYLYQTDWEGLGEIEWSVS
jgi:hypothetical protein